MLIISGFVVNAYSQSRDTTSTKLSPDIEKIINELQQRGSYNDSKEEVNLKTRECSKFETNPWRNDGKLLNNIFKYPYEGNVGIGICDPLAKLHVAGDYKDSIYFLVSEFIPEMPSLPVGELVPKFSVVKSKYEVDKANVGINTESPITTLDVIGNSIRLSSSNFIFSKAAYFTTLDPYKSKVRTFTIGDYYINENNSPVIFGSGSINVSVKGRLGIGMTPSKSLDVNGTARVGYGNGHLEFLYDGANGIIEYNKPGYGTVFKYDDINGMAVIVDGAVIPDSVEVVVNASRFIDIKKY